jgi:hypothetical protein
MQTAGKLTIILKAADLVHGGDTNQALRVLVGEVDYGLAELGLAQERAQLDSNAERSLRFCLAYRATNSWIEAFEDPQSATVQRARMLVKKSQ